MKIYVKDIYPKKITRDKLLKLDEYYSSKKEILEIFSEKGMYLVENSKVWKIVPTNEKLFTFVDSENNVTFLIDETIIEKQPSSQIPIDHSTIETTIFIYNGKNVRLLIEGYYKKNAMPKTSSEKYHNFLVTNFYFEPKNNNLEMTNPFLKNEINVFLSLLN
jgi:hypothetical protein